MRARHRVSKLLLRREIVYPCPGRAWTQRYRAWLGQLCFDDTTSGLVLEDLSARDRHAERGRVVRGDRRLRPLPGSGKAGQLCRACPPALRPAVSVPGSARSARPVAATPAGCWSRPPTTTVTSPASALRSNTANEAKTRERSSSPGRRNATSTPAGSASTPGGANPPASAPWPSPANSATTSGGSRHCANSGWAIPPQTSGGGCRGAKAGTFRTPRSGARCPYETTRFDRRPRARGEPTS